MMPSNIADTGIKGFLKWLKEQQPGIYQKAAPQIAATVPEAFSNYEASQSMATRLGGLRLGQLAADDTQSSPGLVDISFDPSQLMTPTPIATPTDNSDVSDVANQGSSSPSVTSAISNVVGAVTSLFLAKNQISLQNQVTQIQLQRAQAGLPPLPINMNNLGVPTIGVGLSASTQSLVEYGMIGLGLILLIGALGKGRR